MRIPYRLFCLILLGSLIGPRLHAELTWDQPTQEFHRMPTDKEIWVHYAFHNKTTAPVTITDLRPSCGCTTAHLEKKTYAPGESGDVLLHFVFGARIGAMRKTVTVTTDDRSAPPKVLSLLITINDPLIISPTLVYWRRGEPAAAKTVQLAAPSDPIHIKSVSSSSPRLTAKLEPTKPGEPYAISVTPVDTAQKESAEISVQTDFPPDAPHTYTIWARIK
jgi:hypothetical protein